MSLKKLEEKAVEIFLNKTDEIPTKVVSVEGSVESVSGFNEPIKISPVTPLTTIGQPIKSYITGYQKKLHIVLNPKTSTPEKIGLLNFQGTSPVRGGDRIKAGLILDEYFEKHGVGNILYLDILKQGGFFWRRDFVDGYNPMQNDIEKLGLL